MKKILYIFIALLFVSFVFGQKNDKVYFTGSVGYGLLLPHKSVVNHLKNKPALVAEIGFLKQFNSTPYHVAYNKPSLGMNLHLNTTGNQAVIGNGYALDFYGIAPLGSGENPLQFKAGAGVGYIQKPFDSILNPGDNAIGSYYNVHVQIHFEKLFYINDHARINTGFAFSHFSNAATQMPNYGLNFVHLTLGYEFMKPNSMNVKLPEVGITLSKEKVSYDKWTTSINAGWGYKENNNLSGNKYNVYSFTLREELRINIKSTFAGALNLYQNYAKEAENGTALQTGLSFGYFLNFEKLRTGVLMGVYTSNGAGPKVGDLFYHKYIIEYQFAKRMYAQILLKSHWAAADFFNVTLGYRFRNHH